MQSFSGVARVINTSEFWLPAKSPMTRNDIQSMHSLQSRAHLEKELVERDKDGNVARVVKPLTDEERDQLAKWELCVQVSEYPHVGDNQYPFAPSGEKGCAWLMPEGHARLLTSRFPQLRIMGWHEPLPEGVELRQPRYVPSPTQVTYGVDSLEQINPSAHAPDSYVRGQIHRDGAVTDPGDQLPINRPPLPGDKRIVSEDI